MVEIHGHKWGEEEDLTAVLQCILRSPPKPLHSTLRLLSRQAMLERHLCSRQCICSLLSVPCLTTSQGSTGRWAIHSQFSLVIRHFCKDLHPAQSRLSLYQQAHRCQYCLERVFCTERRPEIEMALVICLWAMMSPVTVMSPAKRSCITQPMGERRLASEGILGRRNGEDTKAITHIFEALSFYHLRFSSGVVLETYL